MAPDNKAPEPIDPGSPAAPLAAIDEQICRQCAGLCCQSHPGVWVDPLRFADAFFPGAVLTLSRLIELSPRLELDIRQIGGVPVPAPRRLQTDCAFLGPTGCRFEPARRPCQCLALVPSIDTLIDGEIHCRMPAGYGTDKAQERWERFWMQPIPHRGGRRI